MKPKSSELHPTEKQQPDLVAETGQRGSVRTFHLMKVHLNFWGLPGLILRSRMTNKTLYTPLVKSQNLKETYPTQDFVESFFGSKAVPITEQQKQKLFMEYYNDPLPMKEIILQKQMVTGRLISTEKKYKIWMN